MGPLQAITSGPSGARSGCHSQAVVDARPPGRVEASWYRCGLRGGPPAARRASSVPTVRTSPSATSCRRRRAGSGHQWTPHAGSRPTARLLSSEAIDVLRGIGIRTVAEPIQRSCQDTKRTRGHEKDTRLRPVTATFGRLLPTHTPPVTWSFVRSGTSAPVGRSSPARIQVPVSERTWGFKSPLAHPL